MRIMRTLIAAALAATCLAGGALRAAPVEERDVVSGKAKLDPAMGYILISGPERQFGCLVHQGLLSPLSSSKMLQPQRRGHCHLASS